MPFPSVPCQANRYNEAIYKESSKLREFPVVQQITFQVVLMKAKSFWFQLYFEGFCWHQEWRSVVMVFLSWDIQSWFLVCCIFFLQHFFFCSFCHRPLSLLIPSYFHILILHLVTLWTLRLLLFHNMADPKPHRAKQSLNSWMSVGFNTRPYITQEPSHCDTSYIFLATIYIFFLLKLY